MARDIATIAGLTAGGGIGYLVTRRLAYSAAIGTFGAIGARLAEKAYQPIARFFGEIPRQNVPWEATMKAYDAQQDLGRILRTCA